MCTNFYTNLRLFTNISEYLKSAKLTIFTNFSFFYTLEFSNKWKKKKKNYSRVCACDYIDHFWPTKLFTSIFEYLKSAKLTILANFSFFNTLQLNFFDKWKNKKKN